MFGKCCPKLLQFIQSTKATMHISCLVSISLFLSPTPRQTLIDRGLVRSALCCILLNLRPKIYQKNGFLYKKVGWIRKVHEVEIRVCQAHRSTRVCQIHRNTRFSRGQSSLFSVIKVITARRQGSQDPDSKLQGYAIIIELFLRRCHLGQL